ncbi:MAG TPA: hypothetical protein PLX89_13145, partial [Verrucomicrobiota bacterium]|nr:hypothetical protein [Verrucomicrobiales bacterium]HRI13940.1 hypothetical protein [Verrucomicrobiota bacterium]
IAAGENQTLALKADGSLVAWGFPPDTPIGFKGLTGIAAGMGHNVALRSDGTVAQWGDEFYRPIPIPWGLRNVIAVFEGRFQSFAIRKIVDSAATKPITVSPKRVSVSASLPVGRKYQLESSFDGQKWIPIGAEFYASDPIREWELDATGSGSRVKMIDRGPVIGLGYYDPYPRSEFWKRPAAAGRRDIVSIAAGPDHNLAVTAAGRVIAWGWNYNGQAEVPANLTDVKMVAGGLEHSLALKNDGTVVAWGGNSPREVPYGLKNVAAIAAGTFHSLALKTDGSVISWGDNSFGQLSVPELKGRVVAFGGGASHSVLLLNDGTVRAIGDNRVGQTDVPEGLGGLVAIAVGSYHTLGLRPDGEVVAWGYNGWGATNVPPGLRAVSIAAGGDYSAALTKEGTIVSWGQGRFRETDLRSEIADIVQIAGGVRHLLVLQKPPPLQAAARAVVAGGRLTRVEVTNPGYGYLQSPSVAISGGGGQGAEVHAAVVDGIIQRVNVKHPGEGYQAEPNLLIASPGGLPSVRTDLNMIQVVLPIHEIGEYQLEASSDFINWVQGSIPFEAAVGQYACDLSVGQDIRLFRLKRLR